MELTAKEILEKHGVRIFGAQQERILAAMKEAVELAFEAGEEKGHWEGRLELINIAGCNNEENYRKGAEINIAKNPNKQEFINSLFPESK